MNELTGIQRAILAAGTQAHLAFLISQALGTSVGQGRVGDWLAKGYVPTKRAMIVARLTSVPIEDLIRQTPRKKRNGQNPR